MFWYGESSSRLNVTPVVLAILLLVLPALAQQSTSTKIESGAVLWEAVNTADRDLYLGPGGDAMAPDLSKIKFIQKEKSGTQKKYRIEDGSGRVWIAKIGREARPETAAVRLLYGLGYKTEVNYLVPTLTIPGKGTFTNVRLEARPANVARTGVWKWKQNPFLGTSEFQGLKIMQAFMTNWDATDKQNEILEVRGPNGSERHYIISDLGRTFGKYGNNNLPIFYRLGRRTGAPGPYSKASFIKGTDKGRIKFSVKGKSRGIYKDITIRDARWILNRLRGLSDDQIEDAFRAANYSPAEVEMYRLAVKRRFQELERLTGDDLASN